jgi:hypothetical protein
VQDRGQGDFVTIFYIVIFYGLNRNHDVPITQNNEDGNALFKNGFSNTKLCDKIILPEKGRCNLV